MNGVWGGSDKFQNSIGDGMVSVLAIALRFVIVVVEGAPIVEGPSPPLRGVQTIAVKLIAKDLGIAGGYKRTVIGIGISNRSPHEGR